MTESHQTAESGQGTGEVESLVDDQVSNGAEAVDQCNGKLVPVSESIRYRRRAQAAEGKLEEYKAKLAEVQVALDRTHEQLEVVERRQTVDQLLVESDAVDLEAARLLTEAALEQMDEPDIKAVVDDLREHKPYLFRQAGSVSGGSMSARLRNGSVELDDAAADAASSGDRRDLLRYLRLRRGKASV